MKNEFKPKCAGKGFCIPDEIVDGTTLKEAENLDTYSNRRAVLLLDREMTAKEIVQTVDIGNTSGASKCHMIRKAEWSTSTIDRMLSNEKYVGQVLMQKTYTPDFLTGKQKKNTGELAIYLIENAHEPIIDRATFERVQEMKGKNKKEELTK